jgi:phosphoribosylglycinamide formyltransferase-1
MIALSEHKRREPRRYDIALVASNVPEARGLVAAKRLGHPTWAKSHKGMAREEFDRLLDSELRRHGCEVVALAGYMRLLSPEFIRAWEGRILNIHPSLLPALQGPRHPRPGAGGGRGLGGLLGPRRDRGARRRAGGRPGQGQDPRARDAGNAGGERVLEEEHKLYPEALDAFAAEYVLGREGNDG